MNKKNVNGTTETSAKQIVAAVFAAVAVLLLAFYGLIFGTEDEQRAAERAEFDARMAAYDAEREAFNVEMAVKYNIPYRKTVKDAEGNIYYEYTTQEEINKLKIEQEKNAKIPKPAPARTYNKRPSVIERNAILSTQLSRSSVRDIQAVISLSGYVCDTISYAMPLWTKRGAKIRCNKNLYKYEIETNGEDWVIRNKTFE